MCRLVGCKQMRKMRSRSVSQAHCQSFNGTRLLDICLATKRVSCLTSVGSELGLLSVNCQLHLLHGTNDGSDLFNGDVAYDMLGPNGFTFLVILLPDLVMFFKRKLVPFRHRIKSGCIGFHFVRVVVVVVLTTSASTTLSTMSAVVTTAVSPRMSVLIKIIS